MSSRVREVLSAHLPGYRVESVVELGAGLDNLAYRVNDELVVRFGNPPDPEHTEREARLLALVATISPLAVPQPLVVVPALGCLVYPKLPGVPLLELADRPWLAHVIDTLGEFLDALHTVPPERVAGLVDTDDDPPSDSLAQTALDWPLVAGLVPGEHHRAVSVFLDTAAPPGPDRLVFSHNDLGIEHVLVDPATGRVSGIIDWSDAAVVDPAYDYGCLYRDAGPIALARCPAGLRERAVFHARCGVLEDLCYGVTAGRGSYLVKGLAALDWLFPAG